MQHNTDQRKGKPLHSLNGALHPTQNSTQERCFVNGNRTHEPNPAGFSGRPDISGYGQLWDVARVQHTDHYAPVNTFVSSHL